MIEPRKDAYGPEADASNLADWLELLALAGRPMTRADLADYLRDNTWTVRSRELYHTAAAEQEPGEDEVDGGAGVDPTEEQAGDVFAVSERRSAELGALWPFVVDDLSVTGKDPLGPEHQPYLRLLALTVAHHYDVEVDEAPEHVFEGVVARALRARGLATFEFGAGGRQTENDFRATVQLAGPELLLITSPEGAMSRKAANDEGVDTISHFSWGDRRPGHWLFIGQATVGRSNTWKAKIKEPDPPQWAGLLGSHILPTAFLAVPHHVEDTQLYAITEGTSRLVLDRLRLCRFGEAEAPGVDQVLAAVLASGAFDPRE